MKRDNFGVESALPTLVNQLHCATMDFNFADLENVMAENAFYTEETKQDSRPRSLSLSINKSKPDWSAMLNTNEKSMRFTDTLLDTPEILSQCVDWQLNRQPETEFYIPQSVDESTQITAIKNELQHDYENTLSPSPTVLVGAHSPYYFTTENNNNLGEDESRAGDGSASPALSEAQSSMVADDEGDDDTTWLPSDSGRRRVGRPRSTTSCSNASSKTYSAKTKGQKRKLSDYSKESTEYKEKRKRNNIAVRKSRDKAKQHHFEIEERNSDLEKQNGELRKTNDSLTREVSVLRKLITDIGRKIPTDLSLDLDAFTTL